MLLEFLTEGEIYYGSSRTERFRVQQFTEENTLKSIGTFTFPLNKALLKIRDSETSYFQVHLILNSFENKKIFYKEQMINSKGNFKWFIYECFSKSIIMLVFYENG